MWREPIALMAASMPGWAASLMANRMERASVEQEVDVAEA
ncbi:hypothetical protein HNR47_000930 [Methylopila jiangsuensis]|nr:hypothetical protein [Methylopila jiangsuensis]